MIAYCWGYCCGYCCGCSWIETWYSSNGINTLSSYNFWISLSSVSFFEIAYLILIIISNFTFSKVSFLVISFWLFSPIRLISELKSYYSNIIILVFKIDTSIFSLFSDFWIESGILILILFSLFLSSNTFSKAIFSYF